MRVFLILWIYVALSAVAAAYAWYKGAYDPAHSEFSGMPLIILALPWSWLWRNFNPRILGDQYNNSIVMESIFIGLNTVILGSVLVLVRMLGGRVQKQ